MNGCYRERFLEKIAVLLAKGTAGAESSGKDAVARWAEHGPASKAVSRARVAAHLASCVRCGELLDLFLGTERAVRNAVEGVVVLPLRTLPGRRERSGEAQVSAGAAAAEELVPYEMAADSSEGQDQLLPTVPELTLASSDGRYLVRIKADSAGPGAVAILLADLPVGDSPSGESRRVALRLAGEEHPFDPDGIAHLPTFPIGVAYLVLS